MRIWKQAVVSLVVIAAAVVLWARYFPVVSGMLQRAGIATAAIEADRNALEASGFAGVPPAARATPVVQATVNDRVSAIGDGLIDAAMGAIARAAGVEARLVSFHVQSVTGGSDALGDVIVQLDVDGRRVTGRGVATDVVEASARAYLAAVNRALQVQAKDASQTNEVTP